MTTPRCPGVQAAFMHADDERPAGAQATGERCADRRLDFEVEVGEREVPAKHEVEGAIRRAGAEVVS